MMKAYNQNLADKKFCILQLGTVPPSYGGVSSFIHGTSRYLAKTGHRVIVAPLSFKLQEIDHQIESERNYKVVYYEVKLYSILKLGVRFVELFIITLSKRTSRRVFWGGLRKILRIHSGIMRKLVTLYRLTWVYSLCKCYKIDIIVGHHAGERGLISIMIARVLNIPSYSFLHGGVIFYDENTPANLKDLVNTVVKYGKEFLFCSLNSIKRAEELGMDGEKAVHVGEGVDIESIKCRVIPAIDAFHIMNIGYLSPHRGLEQLIRAVDLVRKRIPNIKVSIIGDDPFNYWAKLEKLVFNFDMTDSVKYFGRVTQEFYKSLLRSTHVAAFLLQGEKTGSLAACLEVQAAGVPVLTTGLCGLDEYIQDGVTGLICGTSSEDVAEGIVRMYEMYINKQWLPELIRAYAASHSWQKVALNLETTFKRGFISI